MASALFDINGDGNDQGYEAENAEVLTLQLRQQPPIGVTSVLFQVFDPMGFDASLGIAANPPRASKGAQLLTLVGPTSGQAVSPATVDGSVTITMPATGSGSWIVRCVVNGGLRTLANGTTVLDTSLIHERGIWLPTQLGTRRVVCTELRQFEDDGWAGALSTLAGVPLAPRPSKVLLHDAFMTGNTASGSIGSLGWNLLGVGTPAYSRSAFAGTNGLLSPKGLLQTSGAANDRATLAMGETDSRGVVISTDVKLMQLMHSFNNQITSKRFFFGLIDNFASVPSAAANCLGIYFDTGVGGNYLILSRSSSTGSPIDSGIAPNLNEPDLLTMLQLPDGSFSFYQGETLLGTLSSNLPFGIAELNVGMSVQTLVASSRGHRFGRFIFESVRLGGVLSADTFLDA